MNRRELMKTAVIGAGAAVTGRAQKTPAESWTPRFLDPHQNETIIALTNLIIPATDTLGAKEAQVNRFIDLMLSESPADERRRFLSGLSWLDGYALRSHHAPFVKCTPGQKIALLASLDPSNHPAADPKPGSEFFREIKRRTVAGYYNSKIGFELNKGGRVPSTLGCSHESHG